MRPRVRSFFLLLILCSTCAPLWSQTNWGKWGPDDQIGTLNYVTADVVIHAASLVEKGKVFNLALPLEKGVPSGGNRYGRIRRYMIAIGDGDGDRENPGLAFIGTGWLISTVRASSTTVSTPAPRRRPEAR